MYHAREWRLVLQFMLPGYCQPQVPTLLNNHSPSLLIAMISHLFVQLLYTRIKNGYSRDAGAAVTPNMPPLIPN